MIHLPYAAEQGELETMWRSLLLAVVTVALFVMGCELGRSYPETFLQSPSSCEVVELRPGLNGNYEKSWKEAMNALENGWDTESGWEIEVAAKDRGFVRTAWRYGYSCYRFGDYRRRITLCFSTVKDPGKLYVKTEAERKKRTAEFLWWGGKAVGWIKGSDPAFQQEVYAEMRDRLGVGNTGR
ncbi:MAG: hypothetical protein ACYSUI_26055 [Planctomycetota bacterium]